MADCECAANLAAKMSVEAETMALQIHRNGRHRTYPKAGCTRRQVHYALEIL